MKYRTVFVSDIHLGTKISRASQFLEFIKENEFEQLYLVGDIIDIANMKRNFYWTEEFNTVLQKLLRLARKGVQITYVIGNHDMPLQFFIQEHFGNIVLCDRAIHTTAKGEKCLVIHGHQFDGIIKEIVWLYWLGDTMYDLALLLNRIFNKFRHFLGLDYWSLSHYLKSKVKNVIQFVNNFEQLVIHEMRNSQPDAKVVIAGHVHVCADKNFSDVRYLNCGCWTEFCSAVVEHEDGSLEVIKIDGLEGIEEMKDLPLEEIAAKKLTAQRD